MNFTVIFLSFTAVWIVSAFAQRLFGAFAERELRKSKNVRFAVDAVEIFAERENFEYLFRLALALPSYTIRVYVGEDKEAECIAEVFLRFYDFEIVKIYS